MAIRFAGGKIYDMNTTPFSWLAFVLCVMRIYAAARPEGTIDKQYIHIRYIQCVLFSLQFTELGQPLRFYCFALMMLRFSLAIQPQISFLDSIWLQVHCNLLRKCSFCEIFSLFLANGFSPNMRDSNRFARCSGIAAIVGLCDIKPINQLVFCVCHDISGDQENDERKNTVHTHNIQ